MYCLISPQEPAYYISSWVYNKRTGQWDAVFSAINNSCRIAQVSPTVFDVAPPLFWKECGDQVVADYWYLNSVTDQILEVPPPAPFPTSTDQQTVQGAQTL